MAKQQPRRNELRRQAFIYCGDDQPWFECLVLDVSADGATIEVGDLKLPKAFILYLTENGAVYRRCLVVWRQGSTIGVRFPIPRRPKPEPD